MTRVSLLADALSCCQKETSPIIGRFNAGPTMAHAGVAPADGPSEEELFKLLKLCGSEEQVVIFLARTFGLAPQQIAPTVMSWLAALPAVPPPSRQRSAPPDLSPESYAALSPASFYRRQANRVPDILPIRTPPPSAPVHSGTELMASIRSIDWRLNRSSQAKGLQRKALDLAPQQRVEFNPTIRMLPASVPEDSRVDHPGPSIPGGQPPRAQQRDVVDIGKKPTGAITNDEALAAYLQRHAMLHASGSLTAGSVGKRAGGWNYS